MRLASWFRRSKTSARISSLKTTHASDLAATHARTFARPWTTLDFEGLIADRSVVADGIFLNSEKNPKGFILSRLVADEAEILTVALAQEARGQGHGQALLSAHLTELANRQVRRVHLEVEEGNAPALALYRRLGFEQVGRRDGYYAKGNGPRTAALTMSLVL